MTAAGIQRHPRSETLSREKLIVGLEAVWKSSVCVSSAPCDKTFEQHWCDSKQQHSDIFMFLFELKNVKFFEVIGHKRWVHIMFQYRVHKQLDEEASHYRSAL